MDEPASLVLDFLRQHNFEKAEEALRFELQARHSFTTPASNHDKVAPATYVGGVEAHEDAPRNTGFFLDKTSYQNSQLKPEVDTSERGGHVGMQHNQMHAYTEWEFKSCSNHDCVLEFKKQDHRLKMPSLEGSSSSYHDARQNGMKLMDGFVENGLGRKTGHAVKKGDSAFSSQNGTGIWLASSQTQQHNLKLTSDHLVRMKQSRQQDSGVYELKKCSFVDEPRELLHKAVHAFSMPSNGPNFARSPYNSLSDTSWLDHGVLDEDTLNSCKFAQPVLHPSEEFGEQEEKQVVPDCFEYFKALNLGDQTYPPDLFKDISLPWETGMQNHFVEGGLLNERQTQPSSHTRSTSGSFSSTKGMTDSIGLDKMHTNALFEPSFNLGSFLDIPVGQEIASPGEKHENGVCQLSYSQNVMQDTPELLSGFATLGDEPTDPGMGYSKEYWDSDMYEDDEDPGYERREIEDEEWFLAHEIFYPNEGDKVKEEIGDTLSQSNEGSEMVQEKEDSPLYSGKLLDIGVCDVEQAKVGLDISSINTNVGNPSTGDNLTLKQIGIMSYDGQLMDADELKLMRVECVWQGFSSQIDKHVHHDEVDEGNAHDKPCEDYLRETDSGSDTPVKKTTQVSKWRKDSLQESNLQSYNAFDPILFHGNHVPPTTEVIKNLDGISNRSKIDFMSAGVKEATEFSHVNKSGDAFSCSATVNMKGMNGVHTGCFSSSFTSNEDKNAVILELEENSTLSKRESGELSPVLALENGTSSIPSLFSHPKVFNHISMNNGIYVSRDEGTAVYAYDNADNEPAVDDGETSTIQEAQLVKTEEDDYEVFSLRIIHRKNRTGFEEEKHFQVVLNSVVAGRYLITEYLGSAAFSKAVQARDLQTGMDVCMKIIKNNKDFFDQSLDEIKLLKYINKNDPADRHHLLRLYDYFYHREHLFIVCELLRANLYEFHKFNKESGGEPYFTMSRLQAITRQCLEALEFLHRLGLIHCDLKPENILIKSYSRCEIKVIDLGSSCFQTDHLCSYVQSRSYRAPEVILGLPYDQKIDIWSLGCILAELCSGNVLFQNDSLATLLARVVGIIEPIIPDMILKGKEAHKYFTKNSILFERNQDTNKLEYLIPKKSSLRHRLPTGDQGFVDFVGYLLQVNSENRPSASEALKHPWLTHPYEPVCE